MKKLFIIPSLIVFFVAGYYAGIVWTEKKSFIPSVNGIKTVNLMIDNGDDKISIYNQILVNEGDTTFSLLKQLSDDNKLSFEYKDYGIGMGVFVEGINGHVNNYEENRYWQYWIDGEYAKVGVSESFLTGGEVIEWKYMKGQVEY